MKYEYKKLAFYIEQAWSSRQNSVYLSSFIYYLSSRVRNYVFIMSIYMGTK